MTLTKSYNALNQYTNRTVPGFLNILGQARTNATVTLWSADSLSAVTPTYRKGEYFRGELAFANQPSAIYATITNLAVLNNGTNADIIATNIGRSFLPKTPEVFSHDADGNLTNDARWTYTWDAENRLTSFTRPGTAPDAAKVKVECQYDSRGRRTQKVVSSWNGSAYVAQSTNRFLYDGWNLVGLFDAQSSLLQSFTWGTDLSGTMQGAGGVGGLKSMTVHSGSLAGTYFYCYDGNGNVAALVAAADGSVAAQYEYGPFGEVIRATGPLAQANPFLFSTKFCDAETGFYYYGYRYCAPSTGSWPNRDPIAENGGVNRYGFVANNPVSGIDLLGLALYAFDGTRNNNREVSKGKFTWVYVLWKDWAGANSHYENGVGSSFGTRAVGGLTGLGGRARLENAYQEFLRNYNSGDTNIDIIGFSRGAAMAREFANMIYERGDGSGKRTVTTQMGKHSITQTVWGKPCKIPDIRFVGLFDTVGSFGVPGNQVNVGYNLGLPPNVKVARHAVAADEQRYLFPLTPLGSGGDGQDFEEIYFPGDHSDIGRGHGPDTRDLSFAPYFYIWSEGRAAGVPFGSLRDFTFTGNTTPHDLSSWFPYPIFPKRPR